MYKLLNFFSDYMEIILPALSAVVVLFAVVNFLANPFRKQNKKINLCLNVIRSFPHKTESYVMLLPDEYRRQWRAYVNSRADKPSQTFEFVPKRFRIRALRLFVLSAVISAVYVAVFALIEMHFGYLVYQAVVWLAFALTVIAAKEIFKLRQSKAKKLFAALVAQLNKNVGYVDKMTVEETTQQINKLKSKAVSSSELDKASELLRNKGLEGNRTVEQQRKLNEALNGLLQAYTQNAQRNSM